MDILTDSRRVSRLEVVETGRRRRWSDAEKLRIVEESFSGPRLVSATARHHGVSKQIVSEVQSTTERAAPAGTGTLEVVTANGRRVIVDRNVDVAVLLRIMRGLETLR
jgi:transposase